MLQPRVRSSFCFLCKYACIGILFYIFIISLSHKCSLVERPKARLSQSRFFCIIIDTGHPRLAPTSSREGPFHINETFFCPCLFISSLTEIRNHWVSVSSLIFPWRGWKNDLKRGKFAWECQW